MGQVLDPLGSVGLNLSSGICWNLWGWILMAAERGSLGIYRTWMLAWGGCWIPWDL